MLEEGYEAGDIVFGRRRWVDIDLRLVVSLPGAMTHVTDVMVEESVVWHGGGRTDLAFGVEELDTSPGLGMCDSIVFSLFIIAHVIEAPWW